MVIPLKPIWFVPYSTACSAAKRCSFLESKLLPSYFVALTSSLPNEANGTAATDGTSDMEFVGASADWLEDSSLPPPSVNGVASSSSALILAAASLSLSWNQTYSIADASLIYSITVTIRHIPTQTVLCASIDVLFVSSPEGATGDALGGNFSRSSISLLQQPEGGGGENLLELHFSWNPMRQSTDDGATALAPLPFIYALGSHRGFATRSIASDMTSQFDIWATIILDDAQGDSGEGGAGGDRSLLFCAGYLPLRLPYLTFNDTNTSFTLLGMPSSSSSSAMCTQSGMIPMTGLLQAPNTTANAADYPAAFSCLLIDAAASGGRHQSTRTDSSSNSPSLLSSSLTLRPLNGNWFSCSEAGHVSIDATTRATSCSATTALEIFGTSIHKSDTGIVSVYPRDLQFPAGDTTSASSSTPYLVSNGVNAARGLWRPSPIIDPAASFEFSWTMQHVGPSQTSSSLHSVAALLLRSANVSASDASMGLSFTSLDRRYAAPLPCSNLSVPVPLQSLQIFLTADGRVSLYSCSCDALSGACTATEKILMPISAIPAASPLQVNISWLGSEAALVVVFDGCIPTTIPVGDSFATHFPLVATLLVDVWAPASLPATLTVLQLANLSFLVFGAAPNISHFYGYLPPPPDFEGLVAQYGLDSCSMYGMHWNSSSLLAIAGGYSNSASNSTVFNGNAREPLVPLQGLVPMGACSYTLSTQGSLNAGVTVFSAADGSLGMRSSGSGSISLLQNEPPLVAPTAFNYHIFWRIVDFAGAPTSPWNRAVAAASMTSIGLIISGSILEVLCLEAAPSADMLFLTSEPCIVPTAQGTAASSRLNATLLVMQAPGLLWKWAPSILCYLPEGTAPISSWAHLARPAWLFRALDLTRVSNNVTALLALISPATASAVTGTAASFSFLIGPQDIYLCPSTWCFPRSLNSSASWCSAASIELSTSFIEYQAIPSAWAGINTPASSCKFSITARVLESYYAALYLGLASPMGEADRYNISFAATSMIEQVPLDATATVQVELLTDSSPSVAFYSVNFSAIGIFQLRWTLFDPIASAASVIKTFTLLAHVLPGPPSPRTSIILQLPNAVPVDAAAGILLASSPSPVLESAAGSDVVISLWLKDAAGHPTTLDWGAGAPLITSNNTHTFSTAQLGPFSITLALVNATHAGDSAQSLAPLCSAPSTWEVVTQKSSIQVVLRIFCAGYYTVTPYINDDALKTSPSSINLTIFPLLPTFSTSLLFLAPNATGQPLRAGTRSCPISLRLLDVYGNAAFVLDAAYPWSPLQSLLDVSVNVTHNSSTTCIQPLNASYPPGASSTLERASQHCILSFADSSSKTSWATVDVQTLSDDTGPFITVCLTPEVAGDNTAYLYLRREGSLPADILSFQYTVEPGPPALLFLTASDSMRTAGLGNTYTIGYPTFLVAVSLDSNKNVINASSLSLMLSSGIISATACIVGQQSIISANLSHSGAQLCSNWTFDVDAESQGGVLWGSFDFFQSNHTTAAALTLSLALSATLPGGFDQILYSASWYDPTWTPTSAESSATLPIIYIDPSFSIENSSAWLSFDENATCTGRLYCPNLSGPQGCQGMRVSLLHVTANCASSTITVPLSFSTINPDSCYIFMGPLPLGNSSALLEDLKSGCEMKATFGDLQVSWGDGNSSNISVVFARLRSAWAGSYLDSVVWRSGIVPLFGTLASLDVPGVRFIAGASAEGVPARLSAINGISIEITEAGNNAFMGLSPSGLLESSVRLVMGPLCAGFPANSSLCAWSDLGSPTLVSYHIEVGPLDIFLLPPIVNNNSSWAAIAGDSSVAGAWSVHVYGNNCTNLCSNESSSTSACGGLIRAYYGTTLLETVATSNATDATPPFCQLDGGLISIFLIPATAPSGNVTPASIDMYDTVVSTRLLSFPIPAHAAIYGVSEQPSIAQQRLHLPVSQRARLPQIIPYFDASLNHTCFSGAVIGPITGSISSLASLRNVSSFVFNPSLYLFPIATPGSETSSLACFLGVGLNGSTRYAGIELNTIDATMSPELTSIVTVNGSFANATNSTAWREWCTPSSLLCLPVWSGATINVTLQPLTAVGSRIQDVFTAAALARAWLLPTETAASLSDYLGVDDLAASAIASTFNTALPVIATADGLLSLTAFMPRVSRVCRLSLQLSSDPDGSEQPSMKLNLILFPMISSYSLITPSSIWGIDSGGGFPQHASDMPIFGLAKDAFGSTLHTQSSAGLDASGKSIVTDYKAGWTCTLLAQTSLMPPTECFVMHPFMCGLEGTCSFNFSSSDLGAAATSISVLAQCRLGNESSFAAGNQTSPSSSGGGGGPSLLPLVIPPGWQLCSDLLCGSHDEGCWSSPTPASLALSLSRNVESTQVSSGIGAPWSFNEANSTLQRLATLADSGYVFNAAASIAPYLTSTFSTVSGPQVSLAEAIFSSATAITEAVPTTILVVTAGTFSDCFFDSSQAALPSAGRNVEDSWYSQYLPGDEGLELWHSVTSTISSSMSLVANAAVSAPTVCISSFANGSLWGDAMGAPELGISSSPPGTIEMDGDGVSLSASLSYSLVNSPDVNVSLTYQSVASIFLETGSGYPYLSSQWGLQPQIPQWSPLSEPLFQVLVLSPSGQRSLAVLSPSTSASDGGVTIIVSILVGELAPSGPPVLLNPGCDNVVNGIPCYCAAPQGYSLLPRHAADGIVGVNNSYLPTCVISLGASLPNFAGSIVGPNQVYSSHQNASASIFIMGSLQSGLALPVSSTDLSANCICVIPLDAFGNAILFESYASTLFSCLGAILLTEKLISPTAGQFCDQFCLNPVSAASLAVNASYPLTIYMLAGQVVGGVTNASCISPPPSAVLVSNTTIGTISNVTFSGASSALNGSTGTTACLSSRTVGVDASLLIILKDWTGKPLSTGPPNLSGTGVHVQFFDAVSNTAAFSQYAYSRRVASQSFTDLGNGTISLRFIPRNNLLSLVLLLRVYVFGQLIGPATCQGVTVLKGAFNPERSSITGDFTDASSDTSSEQDVNEESSWSVVAGVQRHLSIHFTDGFGNAQFYTRSQLGGAFILNFTFVSSVAYDSYGSIFYPYNSSSCTFTATAVSSSTPAATADLYYTCTRAGYYNLSIVSGTGRLVSGAPLSLLVLPSRLSAINLQLSLSASSLVVGTCRDVWIRLRDSYGNAFSSDLTPLYTAKMLPSFVAFWMPHSTPSEIAAATSASASDLAQGLVAGAIPASRMSLTAATSASFSGPWLGYVGGGFIKIRACAFGTSSLGDPFSLKPYWLRVLFATNAVGGGGLSFQDAGPTNLTGLLPGLDSRIILNMSSGYPSASKTRLLLAPPFENSVMVGNGSAVVASLAFFDKLGYPCNDAAFVAAWAWPSQSALQSTMSGRIWGISALQGGIGGFFNLTFQHSTANLWEVTLDAEAARRAGEHSLYLYVQGRLVNGSAASITLSPGALSPAATSVFILSPTVPVSDAPTDFLAIAAFDQYGNGLEPSSLLSTFQVTVYLSNSSFSFACLLRNVPSGSAPMQQAFILTAQSTLSLAGPYRVTVAYNGTIFFDVASALLLTAATPNISTSCIADIFPRSSVWTLSSLSFSADADLDCTNKTLQLAELACIANAGQVIAFRLLLRDSFGNRASCSGSGGEETNFSHTLPIAFLDSLYLNGSSSGSGSGSGNNASTWSATEKLLCNCSGAGFQAWCWTPSSNSAISRAGQISLVISSSTQPLRSLSLGSTYVVPGELSPANSEATALAIGSSNVSSWGILEPPQSLATPLPHTRCSLISPPQTPVFLAITGFDSWGNRATSLLQSDTIIDPRADCLDASLLSRAPYLIPGVNLTASLSSTNSGVGGSASIQFLQVSASSISSSASAPWALLQKYPAALIVSASFSARGRYQIILTSSNGSAANLGCIEIVNSSCSLSSSYVGGPAALSIAADQGPSRATLLLSNRWGREVNSCSICTNTSGRLVTLSPFSDLSSLTCRAPIVSDIRLDCSRTIPISTPSGQSACLAATLVSSASCGNRSGSSASSSIAAGPCITAVLDGHGIATDDVTASNYQWTSGVPFSMSVAWQSQLGNSADSLNWTTVVTPGAVQLIETLLELPDELQLPSSSSSLVLSEEGGGNWSLRGSTYAADILCILAFRDIYQNSLPQLLVQAEDLSAEWLTSENSAAVAAATATISFSSLAYGRAALSVSMGSNGSSGVLPSSPFVATLGLSNPSSRFFLFLSLNISFLAAPPLSSSFAVLESFEGLSCSPRVPCNSTWKPRLACISGVYTLMAHNLLQDSITYGAPVSFDCSLQTSLTTTFVPDYRSNYTLSLLGAGYGLVGVSPAVLVFPRAPPINCSSSKISSGFAHSELTANGTSLLLRLTVFDEEGNEVDASNLFVSSIWCKSRGSSSSARSDAFVTCPYNWQTVRDTSLSISSLYLSISIASDAQLSSGGLLASIGLLDAPGIMCNITMSAPFSLNGDAIADVVTLFSNLIMGSAYLFTNVVSLQLLYDDVTATLLNHFLPVRYVNSSQCISITPGMVALALNVSMTLQLESIPSALFPSLCKCTLNQSSLLNPSAVASCDVVSSFETSAYSKSIFIPILERTQAATLTFILPCPPPPLEGVELAALVSSPICMKDDGINSMLPPLSFLQIPSSPQSTSPHYMLQLQRPGDSLPSYNLTVEEGSSANFMIYRLYSSTVSLNVSVSRPLLYPQCLHILLIDLASALSSSSEAFIDTICAEQEEDYTTIEFSFGNNSSSSNSNSSIKVSFKNLPFLRSITSGPLLISPDLPSAQGNPQRAMNACVLPTSCVPPTLEALAHFLTSNLSSLGAPSSSNYSYCLLERQTIFENTSSLESFDSIINRAVTQRGSISQTVILYTTISVDDGELLRGSDVTVATVVGPLMQPSDALYIDDASLQVAQFPVVQIGGIALLEQAGMISFAEAYHHSIMNAIPSNHTSAPLLSIFTTPIYNPSSEALPSLGLVLIIPESFGGGLLALRSTTITAVYAPFNTSATVLSLWQLPSVSISPLLLIYPSNQSDVEIHATICALLSHSSSDTSPLWTYCVNDVLISLPLSIQQAVEPPMASISLSSRIENLSVLFGFSGTLFLFITTLCAYFLCENVPKLHSESEWGRTAKLCVHVCCCSSLNCRKRARARKLTAARQQRRSAQASDTAYQNPLHMGGGGLSSSATRKKSQLSELLPPLMDLENSGSSRSALFAGIGAGDAALVILVPTSDDDGLGAGSPSLVRVEVTSTLGEESSSPLDMTSAAALARKTAVHLVSSAEGGSNAAHHKASATVGSVALSSISSDAPTTSSKQGRGAKTTEAFYLNASIAESFDALNPAANRARLFLYKEDNDDVPFAAATLPTIPGGEKLDTSFAIGLDGSKSLTPPSPASRMQSGPMDDELKLTPLANNQYAKAFQPQRIRNLIGGGGPPPPPPSGGGLANIRVSSEKPSLPFRQMLRASITSTSPFASVGKSTRKKIAMLSSSPPLSSASSSSSSSTSPPTDQADNSSTAILSPLSAYRKSSTLSTVLQARKRMGGGATARSIRRRSSSIIISGSNSSSHSASHGPIASLLQAPTHATNAPIEPIEEDDDELGHE